MMYGARNCISRRMIKMPVLCITSAISIRIENLLALASRSFFQTEIKYFTLHRIKPLCYQFLFITIYYPLRLLKNIWKCNSFLLTGFRNVVLLILICCNIQVRQVIATKLSRVCPVFISLVVHNLAETNFSLELENVPKTKLSNCWWRCRGTRIIFINS